MSRTYRWIHKVWYENGRFGWLLLPLSGLYWLIVVVRRFLYRRGILPSYRATAPVIVVGNITAGGTGKTPTVVWLVKALQALGYSPGVVSRGYGGSRSGASMRVDIDSDPSVVGDEPVLLARRAQCPVVVDSDRVRAASMLVEDAADVVVTDDGLQHLRLQRDFEICVVDAARRLGNGRLLPAGPLREPAARLESVDCVLVNGEDFHLRGDAAARLNGSSTLPLERFSGKTAHAVAGIGNPGRFFDLLRGYGMQVIEHPLPDHATPSRASLEFGDDFDVFMTEKDAVKLSPRLPDKFWYVPVNADMEASVAKPILERIEARLRACRR